MRKLLLTLFGAILALPSTFARDFQYTYEGQTLTYTVLDEAAKTVQTKTGGESYGGNDVSGKLIIPAIAKDGDTEYTVTELGFNAFYKNRNLTSVTIPESVTLIGVKAFDRCSGLTEVTIPNSVTEIGSAAFYNCSALPSVTIPSSVTAIGTSAFWGCSSLTSVSIPNTITEIVYGLFSDCSSLTSVTIPTSVTVIGQKAFSKCRSLTSVTIPSSVTLIDCDAFWGCSGLTSVTIPNSVTEIGGYAFAGCSNLTSITIPESVTIIGCGTFSECSGLTSVTIPESVTEIEDYAFKICSGLTSVTIPNSVTAIGEEAFYGCESLKSVKISNVNDWARISFVNETSNPLNYAGNLYVGDATEPVKNLVIEGAQPISDFAFYGASCLERVRIKDGAEAGDKAFYNCSNLTDICLNSGALSAEAFGSCTNLKNVYVPLETPPTAPDNAFSKYDGVNLYVPQGCVSAYQKAECWRNFYINESNFADIDEQFAPDYENTSAIELPEVDHNGYQTAGRPNDIYNLRGVCLKRNASADDINALAPGLYIIGGKKVLVK